MVGGGFVKIAFLTMTTVVYVISSTRGHNEHHYRDNNINNNNNNRGRFTSFSHGGLVLPDSGNTNCPHYSPDDLDARKCSQTIRDHDRSHRGDLSDLNILMTDAEQQESRHDFLVYITTYMYQYIHCASQLHAVADLFYGVPITGMPPSTSDWWQKAYDLLHPSSASGSGANLVGRRRKRAPANADQVLLLEKIKNVANETHPACIQWLIEQYLGVTKAYFITENPSFPDPNHFTAAPVQLTSPTTQPTPSTTTPLPTTTVTTQPSSTSTTASTSPSTAATLAPLRCVVCSDLDCLIQAPDKLSQQCDGGLCMVHMVESAHFGRTISRSCGSLSKCAQVQNNDAQCQKVETDQLDWDTDCYFCCQLDMCNTPPLILPQKGPWYPPTHPPPPADGR